MLDRFEFDSGIMDLESAIRYSIYELGRQSIVRFVKEKAAIDLLYLVSKLRLFQIQDGKIFYDEHRQVQKVGQFSHPVLLAYFAANSLRKLDVKEMVFRAKYNNLSSG